MEFRNPNEVGMPSSPSGYNSSLIRGGSAFSNPTLSPTSSLLSPRVGGGGLGGGGGGGAATNGNILGSTRLPPPPPTLEPTTTTTTTTMDPSPQSLTKNTGQAFVSNSSPGAAGAGVPSKTEPAAITSKTSITTATADISTRYKECLRNHAAAIGGHVVDGCGEFMPSGYPDTAEALNCAACGCHRSFHRREVDGGTNAAGSYYYATDHLPVLLPPPHPLAHPHHHHQKPFQLSGFSSPSPTVPGSSGFFQFGSNRPSGSGGTTTDSSSEERIKAAAPTAATMTRKRFRTKFTAEQKKKMLAFAERIGWTIQRQDSEMIEQFCAEIGVRRQVLKVWMHNNKHTIIRKQPPPQQEQEPPVQQQHQQPPESRLPYSSCGQDQALI